MHFNKLRRRRWRLIINCPVSLTNFIQGSAWERQPPHVTREVLRDCTDMQLLLVPNPRLLFYHFVNHFMGLLGIPKVRDSPADWIGHGWARSWVFFPRLVSHRLIPWQPSHQPLLCHCQCCCWLFPNLVCANSNILLGSKSVRCQEFSNLLLTFIHCPRTEVQCFCHCERQVPAGHSSIWKAGTHSPEFIFCSHIWYWFCRHHIYPHSCGTV